MTLEDVCPKCGKEGCKCDPETCECKPSTPSEELVQDFE
jgi:hypothetical protein